MLWAWERPEDLRFIDAKTTGVAFLAQTVTLSGNDVLVRARRQPLEVPEGTYVMAVTRIETVKPPGRPPVLTDEQADRVSRLVARSLRLPNVRAVQLDFDAVVSERTFYKVLLNNVRQSIPEQMPLSMTSLASWCIGDRWFGELPVDEVIPMAFEMGTDETLIRSFLNEGNDWSEDLCKQGYGLMAGDAILESVDASRRIYFFKTSAWKSSDLELIK